MKPILTILSLMIVSQTINAQVKITKPVGYINTTVSQKDEDGFDINGDEIYLYSDINYKGTIYKIPCNFSRADQSKNFKLVNLTTIGCNDIISSIKIPNKYKVFMWVDINGSIDDPNIPKTPNVGYPIYTSSISEKKDFTKIRRVDNNVKLVGNWNDNVSSIEIRKN